MALNEQYYSSSEIHPIDVVEHIAEHHEWEFERVADDQIAMVVEGQWRSYAITLAWSSFDQTLRLISTFELEPPQERQDKLFECLNLVNDKVWSGAFTFWPDQNIMVWRYGLLLSEDLVASAEQIDAMISAAVGASERFYPAFQLVCWTDRAPHEALDVAICETYGRA